MSPAGTSGVWSDVARQFGHEALTEAHHFVVALALRIEIRSAFAAAHHQRRERVLEDLFEGEKLEDAEVDRRVEPQPALVGAECAVHFDAESAIDLDAALVILPRHSKHDHALGLDHAFENAR
jgi:hypothetical protein